MGAQGAGSSSWILPSAPILPLCLAFVQEGSISFVQEGSISFVQEGSISFVQEGSISHTAGCVFGREYLECQGLWLAVPQGVALLLPHFLLLCGGFSYKWRKTLEMLLNLINVCELMGRQGLWLAVPQGVALHTACRKPSTVTSENRRDCSTRSERPCSVTNHTQTHPHCPCPALHRCSVRVCCCEVQWRHPASHRGVAGPVSGAQNS